MDTPLDPILEPAWPFLWTGGDECVGDLLITSGTSLAATLGSFPAINRAIFIPFRVTSPFTVSQFLWTNGSTINGNVDWGIYTDDITGGRRVISCGTTAQAGASVAQVVDVADTLITPGYYMFAGASDSATGTYIRAAPALQTLIAHGCKQMAAAFPLPATATFAALAAAFVPRLTVVQGTVV